jgi:hypothetical protein
MSQGYQLLAHSLSSGTQHLLDPIHFLLRVSHANVKTTGLEIDVVPETKKIAPCENKVHLIKSDDGYFRGKIPITIKKILSHGRGS